MDEKDPTLWQQIAIGASSVITWASGEAGRMIIAGGAGGFYRWFMSETRRLRDGAVAVLAGMLSAIYLSPLVLALIEKVVGDLGDAPSVQSTAAFAAGLGGMSVAKIIIALLENQADKLTGGKNDKN